MWLEKLSGRNNPALKKADESLKAKYRVDGFPTFMVLGKDGKEVGRQEGYEAGGPKAFISKLEGFKKKS